MNESVGFWNNFWMKSPLCFKRVCLYGYSFIYLYLCQCETGLYMCNTQVSLAFLLDCLFRHLFVAIFMLFLFFGFSKTGFLCVDPTLLGFALINQVVLKFLEIHLPLPPGVCALKVCASTAQLNTFFLAIRVLGLGSLIGLWKKADVMGERLTSWEAEVCFEAHQEGKSHVNVFWKTWWVQVIELGRNTHQGVGLMESEKGSALPVSLPPQRWVGRRGACAERTWGVHALRKRLFSVLSCWR